MNIKRDNTWLEKDMTVEDISPAVAQPAKKRRRAPDDQPVKKHREEINVIRL